MKILEESMRVWGSIAMDWIIKLPLSKESIINTTYNSILVITNKLIKYVYFLLYIKESGTEELVY